eukprot:gene8231-1497_t
MKGLMQDYSLNVTRFLDYAAKWHPEQEIVCKTPEGPTTITTYADMHVRAQLWALALKNMGIKEASMVGTLAWNTTRHMETWYGIFGLGAICHTVNPRLSDKDIKFIITDAGDEILCSDITFAEQLERIIPECPCVKAVIFLTDRQHMPRGIKLPCPVLCYEELWVDVDENSACGLCYTSGTTGNPKGVLYSHRSNFLHAMLLVQLDSWPMCSSTVCMAMVPMFHANCWGLIFCAPMVGAKLVLPGPYLDGESVYKLMESNKVEFSAGVPTVWLNLLSHVEQNKLSFSSLKRVCIGGAAPPRSMLEAFEIKHGVEIRHLWGMTELSPLGTLSGFKPAMQHLKQVRGPAVIKQYFKMDEPAVDKDQWFPTGDVVSIDKLGHIQITDRSKDVIKSGNQIF